MTEDPFDRSAVIELSERRKGPPRFSELIIRGSATVLDTSCDNQIIKGFISNGDLVILYGPPGAGKTAVAGNIARSISAGHELFGRRVRQVNVLYICLEGAEGFKKRVVALERYFSEPEDCFLYACFSARFFRNDKFFDDALQYIEDCEIELVVVDTMGRYLFDEDENTNKGMGRILQFAEAVAQTKHKPATVFVAHSGKNKDNGVRGHSSILGAADLVCFADRNPDSNERTLTFQKVKDGPDGLVFGYDLDIDDLGEDDEGDRITACLVKGFRHISAEERKPVRLTPTEKKWLDGIHEAFASGVGKLMQVMENDSRRFMAANVSEIRDCLQRDGVCPGPPDSRDTPETLEERKKRERQNAKDLAKWAGVLRQKGKIGFKDGVIWLPEGADQ